MCAYMYVYNVIFKLGFERYRGGIVLVGRGIVRGKCPGELSRGEMSGPAKPICILTYLRVSVVVTLPSVFWPVSLQVWTLLLACVTFSLSVAVYPSVLQSIVFLSLCVFLSVCHSIYAEAFFLAVKANFNASSSDLIVLHVSQ